MTPWAIRLIIANIAMLFLQQAYLPLTGQFALVPALLIVRPWTALTYMFLHAGFGHLFFNMLSLYFFGPRVEVRLGSRRFITLYLVSGLMGAVLSVLSPWVPIVGASGAVFGVMLAFARYWPREPVYLWGIVAVEARILVLFMAAISLYFGVRPGAGGNIAHLAHLGGFVGAFLYLKWIERRPALAAWRAKAAIVPPPSALPDLERWKRIDAQALHPVNREEYVRVMTKVGAQGIASLTPSEREFLDRFSARA
jgi:membrane associated rhomboid family serine protease